MGLQRLAWGVVGAILALSSWAGAETSAEAIFAHVRRANPRLADLSAHLQVDLDATLGPFHDRPHLQGTYYYKREGRHKVDLPQAPAYLKDKPDVFGFSLPRLERYQARIVDVEPRDGRSTWHLELLPKTPQGSIQKVDLWVDRSDYRVVRYQTEYERGGRLELDFHYGRQGNYLVCDAVAAQLRFPAISLVASARARYSDFKFNQGLPDNLFRSAR